MDDANAFEPLSPEVSALLLRLRDGWLPVEPELGPVTRLTWNDVDVTASAGAARTRGDVLEVEWSDDRFPPLLNRDEYGRFANMPFEGWLASGWRFSADMGLFSSNRALDGHYWRLEHRTLRPRLWVARVRGLDLARERDAPGNLRILTTADNGELAATWGHRFEGAYVYYLIPLQDPSADADAFLVIDTGSAVRPERQHLFADVMALQFVLGRAFFVDLVYGVAADFELAAIVGGRHGRDHSHRVRTEHVVPAFLAREHWASEFFSAISKTYRERPELRLYIALSFYLDNLASFHVEGRYLALHVALEAFAFWLLGGDEGSAPPMIDKPRWKGWLNAQREEIKACAATGFGEVLFSRIASVPKRRSSSRVVEDAFARLGLELLPEMAAELEDGRGRIVHTAAMFPERQERLDAYLEPIALTRTMLVALLARAVHYRGAILGWKREPHRPYDEPSATWWPVDPECRRAALRRYEVVRG